MTAGKAIGLSVLAFIGLTFLIVVGVMWSLGVGWFAGEANLRSFGHVRETYREAFDDVNSMEALVRQSCRAQEAKLAATDPLEKQQRTTQLLAYENTYDRIKGEYDAYMSDHFRGKIIRPRQLPMPYPTLEDRQKEVCV